MTKIKTYILLSLILSLVVVEPVNATSLADIKKQQQQTQSALDATNNKTSNLEDKQDVIEEEISDMDSELVEIMASISMLEDEISQLEEQIEEAQKEYDAAKASEEQQYDAMKRRIKFMYEKGDTAYIQLFMEAKSMNDMLNKAGYVEKIYEYDRKLLLSYQETQKKVAETKEKLETEQSDLVATQFEYKEEQTSLQAMLNEKKAESNNYDQMIAQARAEAANYKAAIKQQNVLIKQIEAEEARKAAEEAARKKAEEEAKKKAGESTSSTSDSKSSNSSDSGTIITSATGSALGKEIAGYACKFVGYPYVAGGTSLTNGADCSGFTYAVYKQYGYSIPRNSTSQRGAGTAVNYSDAQPGDLICYAGHVAMYIGGGKIVHASSAKTGIKISNATYKEILAVRRVVS
ncbi:MAG: NlpC/P60 family protein [Lachnospiraceae bacterium]|nr:NlpC/P60 family protein [Lachnospiraceae bacterium]